MSEEFLTIKEAAVRTGKAEITIRRFVQRVVKGNDARRRGLIKPSPDELQQHVDGPPPAWRISARLLQEQFLSAQQGSEGSQVPPANPEQRRIVEVLESQNAALERQLTVKDEQIKSLTSLVHSLGRQLNERLRENNTLMQGLQKLMALPANSVLDVVDAPSSQPDLKPAATEPGAQPKPAKPPQKRRGWLGRLFAGPEKSAP